MKDLHNRPVLGDDILTLRAPRQDDVQTRFALGHADEALRMFGHPVPETPYTMESASNWVKWLSDDPLGYCIIHDGTLLGFARLYGVNTMDRNCSVGLGILETSKLGQGIGTQVLRLILAHAFDTLALHRVSLRVAPYNARAIAAYGKVGFVKEGLLRESFELDGVWHDDICMGLLEPEFVR